MTEFQRFCIARCERALAELRLPGAGAFHEVRGVNETYFKAELNTKGQRLEIYVYADEAGFMVDGRDWHIFERPDYSSDDQLVDAFIASLTAWLKPAVEGSVPS